MKTFLCSHLVSLHWSGQEAFANLERISRETATLNSDQSLAVGTAVTLSSEDCELTGTVSRCVLEMSGHEIDITLAQPWSPELFTPHHLFDPDVMIAPRRKGL
jgi:hypothetical protein